MLKEMLPTYTTTTRSLPKNNSHNQEESLGLLQDTSNSTRQQTTMASPNTSIRTEKTFISTDDLLESEDEGVSGEQSGEPRTTHEVCDCRAVRWPPHSWKTIVKSGHDYITSPFLILEVLVLAALLYVFYILPDYLVEAHERPIPIQTTSTGENLIDLTFANSYHHNETIPGSLLNLLCVIFPISVFAVLGIFLGPRGDTHAAICMYLLAMGTKIFVVACIKNYAGYFRPSFYNMCQFNPDTLVCDDETTSARESFPSGHAATALSSMTLLALFLLGKVTGGTRQRGIKADRHGQDHHDDVWTPSLISKVLAVAAASPVFLGMFIATSRVRDNWHHPADVLCGGIIGACCALFAHSLWYPSVYSHYGGIPLATVGKIVTERKKKTVCPKVDLEDELYT